MKTLFRNMACLFVAAAAVSCVHEVDTFGFDEKEERATVRFMVKVPGLPQGVTRAVDNSLENDVDNLAIFVARDSGQGFVMTDGKWLDSDDFDMLDESTATFQLELDATDNPTKLLVWANDVGGLIPGFVEDVDTWRGMEVEEWKRDYIPPADHSVVTGGTQGHPPAMYMTGEVVIPRIAPDNDLNVYIPLLRYVARVDVRLNLSSGSRSFVPVSAEVHRANRWTYIFPHVDSYEPGTTGRVIAPTIDAAINATGTDTTLRSMNVESTPDADTGRFATIYISEAGAVTDIDEQTTEAVCIVVGGYYNGSTTLSYYRIDFNSGVSGHPFGQILRNWHYVFDITSVISPGFPTAQAAADNVANTMQVVLEMWDENVQQVNFPGTGDYMYVDTNSAVLAGAQSAQSTFTVRSTLDFIWRLDINGTGMANTGNIQTASNDYFSVTMVPGTPGGAYRDYTFTVTALDENTSGNEREAGVYIVAQNTVMNIAITQKQIPATERKIRVLSLANGVGGMGRYYEGGGSNIAAASAPMRNILLNPTYFGPDGTVKFGGFTFELFSTSNITPVSVVDMALLDDALESADILIVPYGCNPSQTVTNVILAWAQQPGHVLFLSADAGISSNGGSATNVIMRNTLKTAGDGLSWHAAGELNVTALANNTYIANSTVRDWLGAAYLSQISGVPTDPIPDVMVEAMTMANQNTGNMAFMAGRFGLPNQSVCSTATSYLMWNFTAEVAVPGASSSVTPLAVFRVNVWRYWPTEIHADHIETGMMLVGADIPRRIVYIGESELTSTFLSSVAPDDNPGMPGTPYYNSMTVLMSNIWAWAVDTVLAHAG